MPTEYKDQYTLDGRITPDPRVSEVKVAEAANLLRDALHGDRIAAGKLAEVHTSSDLPFALAHLITTELIPQFDEAERTWSDLADIRTVRDFSPVKLQSLVTNVDGAGVHQNGGLPVVPEGAPYPYVTVSGQESFYSKLQKMGTKFGKTWEAEVNDIEGFYEQIPGELLNLALDTEEREVYDALNSATASIAGGSLPDGTTVTANPTLTPSAIWQAIRELENKTVNGRKVGRSRTGYNVVVEVGMKDYIDWKLGQQILSIQQGTGDGTILLDAGDRTALNGVTVIESAFMAAGEWKVLPKKGGVRRPVLELLRLRGYEAPELRAHGNTGVYLGSSAVVPFNQGSWDNDTIDYRIRYVCGGTLWDNTYVIGSDSGGV